MSQQPMHSVALGGDAKDIHIAQIGQSRWPMHRATPC
jgi:hypothetical protein